jgi:hypothetical protein
LVRVLAAERHGAAALLAQLERQESEYRRYLAAIHATVPRSPSMTRRLAQEAAVSLAEAHLRWLARCREALSSHASGLPAHARSPDPAGSA